MRVKKILRGAFQPVMDHHWTPVELADDSLPEFAEAIPRRILFRFLASGQENAATPYTSTRITSGRLVGGCDVYRHAPDDPVRFNKDWYAIVDPGNDSEHLLVDGPQKDAEHWLDEVPPRYAGVQLLDTPIKKTK